MVEASPIKFYFAKYFFLASGLLLWLVSFIILLKYPFNTQIFFAAFILFTVGLILIVLFSSLSEKIRRVAVGKNKIVVFEGDRNVRFEWPEVKSLKIIPFFNLCKLKIRGKRGSIYFFPSQNIDTAFGLLLKDTSKMDEVTAKRKKIGFK
jgi:hypothetical protein